MKIKWLGHAAFMIYGDGPTIITDPYESGSYGGGISYKPINEKADIVTISHTQHPDHNSPQSVLGSPKIINKPGQYSELGIEIKGIEAFHDTNQGKDRGKNTIFCINYKEISIAHLGDLGHSLNDDQIQSIGKIDVLLIPVGGSVTLSKTDIEKVINQLKPKIIIPMHAKTKGCSFPFSTIDEFISGKQNVKIQNKSEIEINNLPSSQEIIVLDPDKI
jgi:L-ascorbate metabolism protein UlaG (beta-lactamase superfamily)